MEKWLKSLTPFEVTYNKAYDNNPNTKITARDGTDLGVGLVGVGAYVSSSFGIISNPVGWVIGFGVGVYGMGTFMWDNKDSFQRGMSKRQDYIDQGLMPIR